jgi:acyl-CoA thioesterase-1
VKNQTRVQWAAGFALAAALAVCALPARAAPACDAPLDLVRLAKPLAHLAHKLTNREPVTIVAIGSSSTAGAGASSKAANYPSRLEAELKQRFPQQSITVLNRGINGEEIGDMLKRFDSAVIAEKPDLVLWQLGTNSVLRHHPVGDHGAAIRAGLAKLRATGADVVLIDPQFAPKVINKPEVEPMLDLISLTAKQENVDLFRRFDVMKRWHNEDHLAFSAFVSPDGLHMNDWSYACMAKGLALAIADAAGRPMLSAKVAPTLMPDVP